MTWLIAISGLALLIILHELGHLLAARAVGIGVECYSLFFGPAMFKFRWRDVEWRLGTIPLGGYVRLRGQQRPQRQLLERFSDREVDLEALHRAFTRFEQAPTDEVRAAYTELATLTTAAVSNSDASLRESVTTDLAVLAALTHADCWWLARPWKRIVVLVAGPLANVILAFFLLGGAHMIGGVSYQPSQTLALVQPGSPAAAVGLKAGDRLLSLGGTSVPAQMMKAIENSGGRTISVTLLRGKQRQTITLRSHRVGKDWRIGVTFVPARTKHGLLESARLSLNMLASTTREMAQSTVSAVQGQGTNQLVGPIGVVRISAQELHSDPLVYPGLLAIISLSLAFLNMLPVPPLDGGQITLALVEAARRRRVQVRSELAIMLVGLSLMVLLFTVAIHNDLGQLFKQP